MAKKPKLFELGEIRKDDEEREYFEKNAFGILNGIFNKIAGRKYAGGSRPSCFDIDRKFQPYNTWLFTLS